MLNQVVPRVAIYIILILATAQESLAQSNQTFNARPYAGIGLGIVFYAEDFDPYEFNASMFASPLRLGVHFDRYFSIEVRAILGINKGDVAVSGGNISDDVKVKLDASLGIFGRLSMPTVSQFMPYATLGYSASRLSFSVDSFIESSSRDSSVSFGLGGDWNLQNNMLINGEFTSYFHKGGVAINMFSMGVTYLY